MSFNMQTSTMECSSAMSFRAGTVRFSDFPTFRTKYQVQAMMVKLKIEAKELFKSITAGNMLEFDWGPIKIVGKEVQQSGVLKKLSRDYHKPIVDITSAKE